MTSRIQLVAMATVLLLLLLFADVPVARASSQRSGYIVHMSNGLAPVLRYAGGHPGFARTKPARSAKLSTPAAHVQSYADHLRSAHDGVLARAGVAAARKLYSYVYTLNAFAAALTQDEAARLEKLADVASVRPERWHRAATTHTPDWLQLPNTAWKKDGTFAKAGEGVIIGVIDSGINFEHPAFSDKTEAYGPPPPQWYGTCHGRNITCNSKLIGANFYVSGFTATTALDTTVEVLSPRDTEGHGSHTASTAAGNHGYPVYYGTALYGLASGMAPRARVAAYKVLWTSKALPGNPSQNSGSNIDIIAAIDAAVSDGCDVLSYSIGGGGGQDFFQAVTQAFLTAAQNGVVVAAAAGNNGPYDTTVENAGPWLLAVAACTHDRVEASIPHLGNKKVLSTGVGIFSGPGTPVLPLINGSDAALPNQVANAALCFAGALDPKKAKGKIVVCLRGVTARTDKGLRVLEAGGAGMILVNTLATGEATVEEEHYLPAAHVGYSDGFPLAAYLASTKTPTGSIVPTRPGSYGHEAPALAFFSARGPLDSAPSQFGLGGSLGVPDAYSRNYFLAPDVCAPGVAVWAAWCTTGGGTSDPRPLSYNWISGTSMSTPHISGIAALMKQKYPTWSPFAIKSAIQTTAYQINNKGKPIQGAAGAAGPFDYGAGHVNAPAVLDPGLVFDMSGDDVLSFLYTLNPNETVGLQIHSGEVPALAPWNLNVPSIALPSIVGSAIQVHRAVTNVYARRSSYRASVSPPAGTRLSVSPAAFSVSPGKVAKFSVLVTVRGHVPGWSFGSVTLKDRAGHSVRITVAVNPSGT